jgi:CBS domain-containing protein
MDIRDVMTRNPRTVGPGDSIQRAASIMKEVDTGFVPIVENGKVVGVVTDRDIVIRAVATGSYDRPVSEIATRDLVSVAPGDSTQRAEKLMSDRQVRRVAVVDEGRLVGIVSLGDLAVKEGRDDRAGATLENIISEGVRKR